ncbi:MAG: tRNA (N6-isopentenyl adenosine(37)-C2)-methylthiotransferase MiaB [Candidatus Izemoplasmatales bacterium]
MKEQDFTLPVLKDARKRTKNETTVVEYALKEEDLSLGIGKKYFIQTHGCQGNLADTEKMKGLLEEVGFEETLDEELADLIIVNTCAIRENAENKVFGELGRFKHLKLQKPDLVIAVGGCMSQEENVVERLLKTYRQVDIIFGTHNLHQLIEFLKIVMIEKRRVVEVLSFEGDIVENVPSLRDSKYKAWVNIMYGCDEFCTYCIVPYTRGKERSRKPEHILKEVQELADKGYQEVTLLGQNVNSYGLDFQDSTYRFADLLSDLSKINIARIRFTTSHPKDFSSEIIDVLASGKNLMPYIHLPVQSGSNKVLKAMNRKYTKEIYLQVINEIKSKIPGVSITTDIIVGFPGETEEDFLETLDLVKQSGFEGAYTFVFSPRKGTPAASFEDLTSKEEKKQRLYRLNELINEGFKEGNKRFLGETVDVLVDGLSKTKDEYYSGYTPHNKLVHFSASEDLIGKIIKVKITEAKTWNLVGEVV